MKTNSVINKKNIKITILILLIISIYFLPKQTNSQTNPQIIFSWQAKNFYPSDYAGKALPTKNSLVSVSLEAFNNNKFIDLSKNPIAWYVDDKKISSGIGLKSLLFKIEPEFSENLFIKAVIQFDEGKIIENSFLLPIVNPQLTIDLPYFQKTISLFADSLVKIKTIPYFFNINSLNEIDFFWEVNGQRQKSDTNILNLNIVGLPTLTSQQKIKITAFAQSKTNSFEISKSEEEILIK